MFLELLAVVAQSPAPGGKGQPTGNPGAILLIGLVLMMVVFIFVQSRSQKRQQRERQALLDQLTKNKKVMTVGGIVGTVTAVRDNEVVLKVDETTNTKMTFLKSAIQQVIKEGESPPSTQ